jgi:hypothetical protein
MSDTATAPNLPCRALAISSEHHASVAEKPGRKDLALGTVLLVQAEFRTSDV